MADMTENLTDYRKLMLKVVADVDDAAMTHIPSGFNNHILWNLGHLAVTQQLLTYGRCKLPLNVPESWPDLFRKGTSPRTWGEVPDANEVKAALRELPEQFAADYRAGRFGGFEPYQTATGPLLETVEDAVIFNDFHEGLHLGAILALRKLV